MSDADQRRLHAAAKTYAKARREYAAAVKTAEAVYERLEASPDTLEYQIEWSVARREEAAAAHRLKQAEQAYQLTNGDPPSSGG